MTNQSEVARLLGQIQTEYESATLGLTGLSQGTCQHQHNHRQNGADS